MSFLDILGQAVGGVQSILGLFGANDAERRAREAAQQAILQFKSSASKAYNDTATAGQGNLYALSGALSKQLERQGGALGQALANAGVYNSSAAAGALANQGQQNAGALATAQTNLGNSLNQLKNETNLEAANMQFGLNQNNLNYSRQQIAGAQGGISSFLAGLGQISNQFAGGRSPVAAGPGNYGGTPNQLGLPARSPIQSGAAQRALQGTPARGRWAGADTAYGGQV